MALGGSHIPKHETGPVCADSAHGKQEDAVTQPERLVRRHEITYPGFKSNVSRGDVAKHIVDIDKIANNFGRSTNRSFPAVECPRCHLVDDHHRCWYAGHNLFKVFAYVGRKPRNPYTYHLGPARNQRLGCSNRIRYG